MANESDIRKFVEQANLPGSSYKLPSHANNKKTQMLDYLDEFRDESLFEANTDYKPFLYYNVSRTSGDKKSSPYYTFNRYEEKYGLKREWRLIDQNLVSTVYVAFALKTKAENHDNLFINASSRGVIWTKNNVFNTTYNLHTVNNYGEFRNLNQLAFALILNTNETLINNIIDKLKSDKISISKIPVKRVIDGQEIDATELNFCMKEYLCHSPKVPFITRAFVVHKNLCKNLLNLIGKEVPLKLLQFDGDFLDYQTSNRMYFNSKKDSLVELYFKAKLPTYEDFIKANSKSKTKDTNDKEAEEITNTVKRKYIRNIDRSPNLDEFLQTYVDTGVITKTPERRTYFYFVSNNRNKHCTSVYSTIAPILKNKDANIKSIFRNGKVTGWYAWGITADNFDSDRIARVLPFIYNRVKSNETFDAVRNFHYVDENNILQNCDTSPFALLATDERNAETIFLKKILERKTKFDITLRPCERNIDGINKVCTEFCFSMCDMPESQNLTLATYESKYKHYNRQMFSLMQEFCDPNIPLEHLQADGSIVDPNTSVEGYLISK